MDKNIDQSKLDQSDGWISAERLRREALDSRPEFSESLHQRILLSVGDRRMEYPTSAARRRRLLAALAAVAACVVVAVAIGYQLGFNIGRPDVANTASNDQLISAFMTGKIEDLPTISILTDRAVSDIDTLLASSGFHYTTPQLSQDARSATDSLMQNIPFYTPSAEER